MLTATEQYLQIQIKINSFVYWVRSQTTTIILNSDGYEVNDD